jgi:hypothetical protein
MVYVTNWVLAFEQSGLLVMTTGEGLSQAVHIAIAPTMRIVRAD